VKATADTKIYAYATAHVSDPEGWINQTLFVSGRLALTKETLQVFLVYPHCRLRLGKFVSDLGAHHFKNQKR
jgi:hypothetical protein